MNQNRDMEVEFKQPPVLHTDKGEIRKAGFELEFGNLDLDTVARSIMELFGGRVEADNKYSQRVVDTRIGDFRLKLDLRLLNEKAYQKLFEKWNIPIGEIHIGDSSLESIIESVLESAVTVSFPYEVDVPPLPFTEVAQVEQLRQALYENKAKGTKSSIFFAFATHINPELPALNVETVLAYTRAFLLLYPWLFKVSEIDFTRRLSSFINPFPKDYVRLVLPASYAPTLSQFIADYHQYNPDRNRPLDLYPVLGWMEPEQVKNLGDLGYVKPRPTFHYRLPNSLMDDPTWTIAQEWNRWYEVERLANAPEKLRALSEAYEKLETESNFDQLWLNTLDEWVNTHEEKAQNRSYGT